MKKNLSSNYEKNFNFLFNIFLIIFTSLVKNSTKDLDSEIYSVRENLLLKTPKDTKLEFNYLSSSENIRLSKIIFEDSLEKKSLNEIK